MPLVYTQKFDKDGSLLIWKITESDQFFEKNLCQHHVMADLQEISHPHKRKEWLAGRYLFEVLCNHLSIDFQGIRKDEHGKPFLVNSTFHVSITHTADYIAIAAHPRVAIGIDMEKPSEKLLRVQHKFLVESEIIEAQQNLLKLGIYWSAKESLYKLNGRKKVPFSAISVTPFAATDSLIFGTIQDEISHISATISILKIDDYFLTIAVEQERLMK